MHLLRNNQYAVWLEGSPHSLLVFWVIVPQCTQHSNLDSSGFPVLWNRTNDLDRDPVHWLVLFCSLDDFAECALAEQSNDADYGGLVMLGQLGHSDLHFC